MFGQERRSKNKLVQRERDRIKKDEEMTDRLAELERIRSVTQKAEFEGSTQAGSTKALRLRELTQQREAALGHTALTLVRKAALHSLLEEEKQQHITELSQQGLTLYQQRI